MNQFNQKYGESVTGTLSGWDRLVFRGTLRTLCFAQGMMGYLYRAGVLLKNFGTHAQAMTYEIYRNRAKKILELKPRMRKCKFIYHYWIDPRVFA